MIKTLSKTLESLSLINLPREKSLCFCQYSVFYCYTYKWTISFNMSRHPLTGGISGPTYSPFTAPVLSQSPTCVHSTSNLTWCQAFRGMVAITWDSSQ